MKIHKTRYRVCVPQERNISKYHFLIIERKIFKFSANQKARHDINFLLLKKSERYANSV